MTDQDARGPVRLEDSSAQCDDSGAGNVAQDLKHEEQLATECDGPKPALQKPRLCYDYFGAGYDLIPLGKPSASGKAPKDRGWRTRRYSPSELEEHSAKGGNLGVRLNERDLVIDVDPRNIPEGDDPLERLTADLNLDLAKCPHVITGGGGHHYYLRIPEGARVAAKLSGYPGIEFKSQGTQVVAAGSIHPATGCAYALDRRGPGLSEAPDAPTELVERLRRRTAGHDASAAAEIESEQLAELLDALNPEDFREYNDWFSVMAASHHVTGGGGRAEFIGWSTSDPSYADAEEEVARHWDSLDPHRDGSITARTLFKLVSAAGRGDLIEKVRRRDAAEDFADESVSQKRSAPSEGADAWVWVAEASVFINRKTLKRYDKDQWKSLHAHLVPDGDILAHVWKGKFPVRRFGSLTYLPGGPEFPDGEEGDVYNIWRPGGVEPRLGDADWFVDHVAYVVPDEREREHLLNFLAHLVQKPAEKILHAVIVQGAQGTGKSAIGQLMRRLLGDGNVAVPSNDDISGRWSGWQMDAQLAVIEEIMTMGRMELMNRLKRVITEDTIRIEEKYRTAFTTENRINLLCFTNHADALRLEDGDRRWFVVCSPAQPREDGYYERLFANIKSDDGAGAVKQLLMDRDLSSFNPKGRAPHTRAKDDMRQMSLSDAEAFLLELFEAKGVPFDFDLMRLEDLLSAIPDEIRRSTRNLSSRVSRFLHERGARQHTRNTKADGKPKYRLWSIRHHEKWEDAGPSARFEAWQQHKAKRLEDEFDLE